MVEYIAPVISLFKMLIDGYNSIIGNIKGKRKQQIFRNLIEHFIILQEISENATEILYNLEKYCDQSIFQQNDIDTLLHSFRAQKDRLWAIERNLQDDISYEMLQLFSKIIQQRILDIVHIKRGVINHLIYKADRDIDLFSKNKKIKIDSLFYHWNHDDFMKNGLRNIERVTSPVETISICDLIPIIRENITSLEECEKQMAIFIKENVDFDEFLKIKRGK